MTTLDQAQVNTNTHPKHRKPTMNLKTTFKHLQLSLVAIMLSLFGQLLTANATSCTQTGIANVTGSTTWSSPCTIQSGTTVIVKDYAILTIASDVEVENGATLTVEALGYRTHW